MKVYECKNCGHLNRVPETLHEARDHYIAGGLIRGLGREVRVPRVTPEPTPRMTVTASVPITFRPQGYETKAGHSSPKGKGCNYDCADCTCEG
jgi:hypothetical protein